MGSRGSAGGGAAGGTRDTNAGPQAKTPSAAATAKVAPWQQALLLQTETAMQETKATSAMLHDALIHDGEETVAVRRMLSAENVAETNAESKSDADGIVVEVLWTCINGILNGTMPSTVGELWGRVAAATAAGAAKAATTTVTATQTQHLGEYNWFDETFVRTASPPATADATTATATPATAAPSTSTVQVVPVETLSSVFIASKSKMENEVAAAPGGAAAADGDEGGEGMVLVGWYITSPALGVDLPSCISQSLDLQLHGAGGNSNAPLVVVVVDNVRTTATPCTRAVGDDDAESTEMKRCAEGGVAAAIPPRRVWMECYNACHNFAQLPYSLQ